MDIPTRAGVPHGSTLEDRMVALLSSSPSEAYLRGNAPQVGFPKSKIKVLLLENVHESGQKLFRDEGFQVEAIKGTIEESQLIEKVKDVHILGIRSKTQVTPAVIDAGKRLLGVGCFCIGTDQVDLVYSEKKGVPVFNAPFANTRSVAEKIIGEIIMLARQIPDRSNELHKGVWKKVATKCYEIRGKTLGIVGYGHIGTQVSVMAESMGMRVIYYDIIPKLPLGNAQACNTLEELLKQADFVTVHVPNTPQTKNMMTKDQFSLMKPGAYFLNSARGKIVNLADLAAALKSGHVGGCAVDVYPWEPLENGPGFTTELQGCPNTILTPHIGGSTEEAQAKIGEEVAQALVKLVNTGSTQGAVNFPNVELPYGDKTHRILNTHQNVPGVLKSINQILADYNVSSQLLRTTDHIGYMIIDVDRSASEEINQQIRALPVSLRTRILY
eukprot:tig00000317_g24016.t1